MSVPTFLQPYLASYDLKKLDIQTNKDIIITEILNKGDFTALTWLSQTYSQAQIKEVVSSPTPGMWLRGILGYWIRILNLKIPKSKIEAAVINLDPYAHRRIPS